MARSKLKVRNTTDLANDDYRFLEVINLIVEIKINKVNL